MQAPFEEGRTWQSTIALLSREGEMPLPVECGRDRPMHSEAHFPKCAIRVLERHTPTSVTVAWSDATCCRYGDQRWRRCVAPKAGVCALSGQAISRGDAVYRPRLARPAPRNIKAMILATVIDTIPVEKRD
jgi:Domain of unknown function (DUF3331)